MLKRKGFVYVLHFDRPLCHSQHYVGCTCNLRDRLLTHATGRGARIVAAALERGIGFRLGALGQCNVTVMRRLERHLKDWHGAADQCECCRPEDARHIPGTTPYPFGMLPFPTVSADLCALSPHGVRETFAFAAERGSQLEHLSHAIKEVMQENKDALGFIPAGAEGGVSLALLNGRVIVTHVNGVLAGYLLWTETDSTVSIHQCCVRDPFRRCGYGRRMIQMLKESRTNRVIQCKVREDLVANGFWLDIGFTLGATETHRTSGQRLNHYVYINGGTTNAV